MLRLARTSLKIASNSTRFGVRTFGSANHGKHGHDSHAHDHKDAHAKGDDHGHGDHGHDDHAHHGPHVSQFHARLGQFCLLTAYLWIMYRFKEDGAALFGFYKAWEPEDNPPEYDVPVEFKRGENGEIIAIRHADFPEDGEEEEDHHH